MNNELEILFNKYRSDKGTKIGPRHSYSEFYSRYLEKIRFDDLLILEIGLCDGKSLRTWYEYLPNSIIIGLDIDDKLEHNNDRTFTFKLDQSKPDQLENFVKECEEKGYKFDMILDDGSHHMLDQQITLGYLFPVLKSGGMFFIEDLHTSLADNGFPLYGKVLDIQENRKNTTLYYLMESFDSVYLTQDQNYYLQQNIDYIEIYNKFNQHQEPQFKYRSITSLIKKK
jgi:hypothetical protein